jgi:hypothetical protein
MTPTATRTHASGSAGPVGRRVQRAVIRLGAGVTDPRLARAQRR